MKFNWVYYLLISQLISSCSYLQERVINSHNVPSIYLNEHVNFNAILPYNYFNDTVQYPVVYLLHGFGGNHDSWLASGRITTTIDSLEALGQIQPQIYILPNGGNSYYINNYNGNLPYSDFFLQEFIPAIDSIYRIDQRYRSLMGLSMGGYGSIVLALLAPDKFNAVVALSAAVRNADQLMAVPQQGYEYFLGEVFGSGLSGNNRITDHWESYSPYYLINENSDTSYMSINWYISCGKGDYLFSASEALHHHFMQYNIPHSYKISSGTHNWDYWHKNAADGLLFIQSTYE